MAIPLPPDAIAWLALHSGVIDGFNHYLTPTAYSAWFHALLMGTQRMQVTFRRPTWHKYYVMRRGVQCFAAYTWFMYNTTPYPQSRLVWSNWHVWDLPRWAPGTRFWLRLQTNYGDGIWRSIMPILEILIPT